MGKSSPKAPAAPDPKASLVDQYSPQGSSVYSPVKGTDRMANTVTLSPEQQNIYNQSTGITGQLYGMGADQLAKIQNNFNAPLDLSNLPKLVSSFKYNNLPDGVGNVKAGPTQNSFGGDDPLTMSVGANDFSADRQKVEDALYGRATSRLDPQFQHDQTAMQTQLTNQGVRPGSAAWNNAMDTFNRGKNDAYSGARNDAITQGGAEQSRLFGLDLSKGQFANTAAGQDYTQNLGRASFANSAQAQDFGQGQANASLANSLRGQMANEQLSGATLNADLAERARQQGIQQIMMRRDLPLNELTALLNGQQVQMPQFGDGGGAQLQSGNNAAYQGALNNYNQQVGSNNAMMGGIAGLAGSLGSAAIMASDMAVKTEITRVGGKDEINIYEWRYKGDDRRYRGVMAQEVTHIPDAVIDDGEFLMVDYSKLSIPFEEVRA